MDGKTRKTVVWELNFRRNPEKQAILNHREMKKLLHVRIPLSLLQQRRKQILTTVCAGDCMLVESFYHWKGYIISLKSSHKRYLQ